MSIVPITSPEVEGPEVSWFSALCSDDYRYLGQPDGDLRSSWAHCSAIVAEAEHHGFRNVLCPSSYQVGQDTLSFVAACGPRTERINFLAAVRCGEMHPILLARTVATLDHLLQGRLTLNIISSDFPGQKEDSAYRYRRSAEVVEILKQAWTRDTIDFDGDIYQFSDLTTDPAKPYQQNGGPLLYFGGYSPSALELCARHCDVYLMWPEPKDQLAERMRAVNELAQPHGRTLDYGLRVHVIVRDTEAEAPRRRAPSSSRDWTTRPVARSGSERSTRRRLVLPVKPRRGSRLTTRDSSSRDSGPASDARGPAAAPRSSAPLSRSSKRSPRTRPWEFALSSSRGTPTSTSAESSARRYYPS